MMRIVLLRLSRSPLPGFHSSTTGYWYSFYNIFVMPIHISHHSVRNKVVVITGASSGVGRAIALAFARKGARLVLAARRPEALNEVKENCIEFGALTITVPTDVTNAEQVRQLAATAFEFGGAIDVWVNNAGVLAAGGFTDTPIEVHEQVIKTNLMGYLHGAHAVLPYFKEQKAGILINNISVGGWIPVPYGVGYSASKFGLRGFSEALRGELSSWPRIHVCDVFPAFLDTPGIQHAANYTGKALKPAPPVYDPQQVARAVVSLARQPKSAVTVGAAASFLRFTHFLFPKLSRNITANVIHTYLKNAPDEPINPGNVFDPVDYGTSIHGGWNSQADAAKRKKLFTKALVAASIVAGIILLQQKD